MGLEFISVRDSDHIPVINMIMGIQRNAFGDFNGEVFCKSFPPNRFGERNESVVNGSEGFECLIIPCSV